jgi:hypothetical protein
MGNTNFGKEKTTELLDENGSTVATESNFVSGSLTKPLRHYYEIKERVISEKEEHEAYLKFSRDIQTDKTKLDPAFKIEHTKRGDEQGYYLIAKCYTVLEY